MWPGRGCGRAGPRYIAQRGRRTARGKVPVFTYHCPGCGKQHVAEKEPEESFTATCLRARAPALAAGPPAKAPARKRKEAITPELPPPPREKPPAKLPPPPE